MWERRGAESSGRHDAAGGRATSRIRRRARRSRDGWRASSTARRCPICRRRACIVSTAPSTRTRSAICSRSTSTPRSSCRPTTRAAASTTWPARSGMSPALLEAYLSAAGKNQPSGRRRGGGADAGRVPRAGGRRPRTTTSKACHSARAAEFSLEHEFPADGEYNFKVVPVNMGNMGEHPAVRRDSRREARSRWSTASALQLFDWDEG